jgi:excisionase family DNA binding protein
MKSCHDEVDRIPYRMLSTKEAAACLQVNEKTIRRWSKTGVLHAAKIGRVISIHPNEVRRLIASGATAQIATMPQSDG